jgi:acyl-CoA hydrolase
MTKTPADSSVESTYLVLPQDTNVHGTAFGGKIMQWMDIAASISAGRHAEGPVVTASVDDLQFTRPIRMGDVVIIRARVNYTGKTSMEVGVHVDREEAHTRRREHCMTAYFTFVGVDAHGKPRAVPAIYPMSEEDNQRFAGAQTRRAHRLMRHQQTRGG